MLRRIRKNQKCLNDQRLSLEKGRDLQSFSRSVKRTFGVEDLEFDEGGNAVLVAELEVKKSETVFQETGNSPEDFLISNKTSSNEQNL